VTTATLAVYEGPKLIGFAARYGEGSAPFVSGEFTDRWEFLGTVEMLLANGLTWTVVLVDHLAPFPSMLPGALEYVAHRGGAAFEMTPLPTVTDAALRHAGLWRLGLTTANQAARLLMPETESK
jgi:hypothetical protein